MKIKSINALIGGEILASPVLSQNEEILIPGGVTIKTEYIRMMKELNIPIVEIVDDYQNYETIHLIITEEKKQYFVEKIQNILEKHIYSVTDSLSKIINLAEELVEYVNQKLDLDKVYDYPSRCPNLYVHTIMVTILSLFIGRKMKLSQQDKKELALGCLLHDLGIRYITVPFENLDIDSMSIEDAHEFKKHTVLGFTVIEKELWLSENVKTMILSHHERLDGTGYPLKKKIKNVMLNILQLCDALDSKISGTESQRKTMDQIIQELQEVSGIQFDEKITKHMFDSLSKYPVGTEVILNTNEVGIVIQQSNYSSRPNVLVVETIDHTKLDHKRYQLKERSNIWIQKVID